MRLNSSRGPPQQKGEKDPKYVAERGKGGLIEKKTGPFPTGRGKRPSGFLADQPGKRGPSIGERTQNRNAGPILEGKPGDGMKKLSAREDGGDLIFTFCYGKRTREKDTRSLGKEGEEDIWDLDHLGEKVVILTEGKRVVQGLGKGREQFRQNQKAYQKFSLHQLHKEKQYGWRSDGERDLEDDRRHPRVKKRILLPFKRERGYWVGAS